MKKNLLWTLMIGCSLMLTSCLGEILNSPMLMLDGIWSVDRNVAIDEEGNEVEMTEARQVDFDAETEVDGFCQGNWQRATAALTSPSFLWKFENDGEDFIMRDDNGVRRTWTVDKQSKSSFIVHRNNSNGTRFEMEFKKIAE